MYSGYINFRYQLIGILNFRITELGDELCLGNNILKTKF